jgi:hypothetical protein
MASNMHKIRLLLGGLLVSEEVFKEWQLIIAFETNFHPD